MPVTTQDFPSQINLLPVEVESKDRMTAGKFPAAMAQMGTVDVKFTAAGISYSYADLFGSTQAHIYESEDDIFSDGEIAGTRGINTQDVIFIKDGDVVFALYLWIEYSSQYEQTTARKKWNNGQ